MSVIKYYFLLLQKTNITGRYLTSPTLGDCFVRIQSLTCSNVSSLSANFGTDKNSPTVSVTTYRLDLHHYDPKGVQSVYLGVKQREHMAAILFSVSKIDDCGKWLDTIMIGTVMIWRCHDCLRLLETTVVLIDSRGIDMGIWMLPDKEILSRNE